MTQRDAVSCRKSMRWFLGQTNCIEPIIPKVSCIIMWIILMSCMRISDSSRVKTPGGWSAQTGVITLTSTSTDIYTDARFGSTFDVTLKLLQVEGQEYQIILGLVKLDALFSPTTSPFSLTQATALPTGNSNSKTSFTIDFFIEEQTLLNNIKINYMLLGAQLKAKLLMMGQPVNVNLGGGRCDGLTAPTTCTYVRHLNSFYVTTNLDATKYKVFLTITGFALYSDSTTTVSPFTSTAVQSKFGIKLISFVSNAANVVTLEVSLDRVSFGFLTFYAIVVHLDMFNPALKLDTVLIEYSKIMTTAGIQQGTFAQKVYKNNYFMGMIAYKGIKWNFNVHEFNPANDKLNIALYSGNSQLEINGFVIYGYTDECTTRRFCRACYELPNKQCTECQKNFIPTNPPNSICRCPRPYSQISGICDIAPIGCIVATRLPDQSIKCHQCNIARKLAIDNTTNSCSCIAKYEFDDKNICKQICGDGFRITLKCDDGNNIAGDGCSPGCTIESGFECDTQVEPTVCQSTAQLIYQIDSIIKIENSNSAIIKLKLINPFNYLFPVYKNQFEPIQNYIQLQTVFQLSSNKIVLNDLQLLQIDEQKIISFLINFNTTIENTDAQLHLNYTQTFYLNSTQTIHFKLKGTNKPLKYEDRIPTLQSIGTGMMIGAVICNLLLLIGLATPKFIGLEAIITLQLIFFSQILIYDNSKFPVGFLFFSNLQYTTGFNKIFYFTKYLPSTDVSRKMSTLERDKMVIQNFNVNLAILFVIFVILIITTLIRSCDETKVLDSRGMQKEDEENKQKTKQKPEVLKFNQKFRKINELTFYISNQIAFWLFLPLVCSISAAICIENEIVVIKLQNSFLLNKADAIIFICASFMMYSIIMSNFGNMWLGNISMKEINNRPEELMYKRQLFIYLTIVSMYIFFSNDMNSDGIYCSAVVLGLQMAHMVCLYLIDPYKQSLRVHTVGIIFNNVIYFIFLVIINVINYAEDLHKDVTLGLGYGMIALGFISIIITAVRLYYELRYGKELEQKIQQERLAKQQEELLRRQLQSKRLKHLLENQAQNELSQRQKLRNQNYYLYENQVKEDEQKQFMDWLEGRQLLDAKAKDAHYFKKYLQKPLSWLKKNDPQKYNIKSKELNDKKQKDRERTAAVNADQKHSNLVDRLKKQAEASKLKSAKELHKHQKMMANNTDYAMSIIKNEKQKFFQKAFTLKKR